MSLQDIPSPLPGTFYRRPSPGEAPFVEPGATIAPGTVVGIVEVMKQFNQIDTAVGGLVVEILVEDGEPVEAGQALMRIKG